MNGKIQTLFRKLFRHQEKITQEAPQESMNISVDYRNLLSPCDILPDKPSYQSVNELDFAISHERCTNIAVTGCYGAGKSSVIETCMRRHPKFKVLDVSLFDLIENHVREQKQGDEYEDQIESKIFKHILYQSDYHRTRQVRSNRINHLSIFKSILCSICVTLGIFAIFFVKGYNLSPREGSIWYFISANCENAQLVSTILYSTSFVIMFCSIIALLVLIIRSANNWNIHRVVAKIGNVGPEFEALKDTTTFEKMLGQLLYFFKAGGYDIVVFEDLDRSFNPDRLFLKFREINLLLNNSAYYKRHKKIIRFIYAVKDNVFQTDVRTKFFDYIVPVIPIVDSYNCGDYLIKEYKDLFKTISQQDLLTLGMYVKGKRELSNVINEFLLYKSANVLKGKMSETKLLAMMIYKNRYPGDYAAAYINNGYLYAIFADKRPFYKAAVNRQNEELLMIKDSIQKLNSEILDICKEALEWLKDTQEATALIYNGQRYSLENIEIGDSFLQLFREDKIREFVAVDADEDEVIKKLSSLRSVISEMADDDKWEFIQRKEQQIREFNGQYEDVERKIELIKREKMCELISMDMDAAENVKENITQICKSANVKDSLEDTELEEYVNMVFSFIRRKYISEDYAMYMSYNYEGSLTKNDFDFVNSLYQGLPLPYELELTNFQGIIEKLHTEDYHTEACLNFSFVDYLIKGKEKSNFENLILTARAKPDFVVQYCQTRGDVSFAEKVFGRWDNCVGYIEKIDDIELKRKMKALFYSVAPKTIQLSKEEKDLIASEYEFISSVMEYGDTKKLSEFVRHQGILFDRLVSPKENNKGFYQYVVENCFFQINLENQQVIFGKDWNSRPLTQILNGDSAVKSYLTKDLNILIPTFGKEATHEEGAALVFLANNEKVRGDILKDYFSNQINKIDADAITIGTSAQIAFDTNVIAATWKNVGDYFLLNKNEDSLLAFIRRNFNQLANQNCTKLCNQVMDLLFTDNDTLNIDEYKRLAPCFASIVIDDAPNKLEDLNTDRLSVLVENKMISYDEENVNFVKAYGASVFAQYLVSVFEDFKEDGTFDESLLTNEVGIAFLNSNATLEQKADMLVNYLSVDATGVNTSEYAKLFCFYINKLNDFKGVDATKIVSAMDLYQEGGAEWGVKMSLINKLNLSKSFNANFETQMLKTLHMESYDKLTYNGSQIVKLDDNPENNQLLDFLKEQNYYISNVGEPILGKRKVSMIHHPLE